MAELPCRSITGCRCRSTAACFLVGFWASGHPASLDALPHWCHKPFRSKVSGALGEPGAWPHKTTVALVLPFSPTPRVSSTASTPAPLLHSLSSAKKLLSNLNPSSNQQHHHHEDTAAWMLGYHFVLQQLLHLGKPHPSPAPG